MAQLGRPRVLDETKKREICAIITAGASLRQAAKYVGCSHSTVKREAAREPEFAQRLERATATAQLAPLQSMRQAAQTHWRAAAWMLERADPEHFGRHHSHHFGSKQLRALKRDLLAILRDEIDHPTLRERVTQRFRATLDYAMRHAWDGCRTGAQLRAAMKFFDKKNISENPTFGGNSWESLDAMLDQLGPSPSDFATDVPRIAPQEESHFAKPDQFCEPTDQDAA